MIPCPIPQIPTRPPVEPGVIDLWRVPLDVSPAGIELGFGILSEVEKTAAGRFHHAADRRRFVARRAARRWILSRYLDAAPESLGFDHGPYGKPRLAGPGDPTLQFSASASADLALIGISPAVPLGVDLEAHRPLGHDLAGLSQLLAPEEQASLSRLPESVRSAAFYACWTRKEAFLKALGTGLSLPLTAFAVTLNPQEPAALIRVDQDPSAPGRWTLIPLPVGDEFSATLAVPVGGHPIWRQWTWPMESRPAVMPDVRSRERRP